MPLGDVTLLPPIPRPAKIVCIGLNYASHAAEQGAELPEYPTVFAKFANALAPAGVTVALPSFSQKVDYEAEVAFVIADTCKDVAEAEALDHVAGYTLFNDLSARDYQAISAQWMPGKVFDHAAPCGPALVTPDEAGPGRRHRHLADAERGDDAGRHHRRPDPLGPRARRLPVEAHDA